MAWHRAMCKKRKKCENVATSLMVATFNIILKVTTT